MTETILTANGTSLIPIPRETWEGELRAAPEAMKTRLAFMTPEHHAVRRFVVSEVPRRGVPIPADDIADALSIPHARVATIIDELEKALFFLVRNDRRAVSWAFPVTADPTPHALRFDNGDRCFAA